MCSIFISGYKIGIVEFGEPILLILRAVEIGVLDTVALVVLRQLELLDIPPSRALRLTRAAGWSLEEKHPLIYRG